MGDGVLGFSSMEIATPVPYHYMGKVLSEFLQELHVNVGDRLNGFGLGVLGFRG